MGALLAVLLSVLFYLTMFCFSQAGYAEQRDPFGNVSGVVRDKINFAVEKMGNPRVESVKDIGGIYEVIVVHPPAPGQIVEKRGIFYVTKDGKFVIYGALISDNYNTYAVLSTLDAIDIKKIDTSSAVVIKKGTGDKKLFLFTDPDCPFCSRVHSYLRDKNDYTLYVFFYPLEELHPGVTIKTIKALCSKDVTKAVTDLVFNHIEPLGSSCKEGKERLEKSMKTAMKVGVEGTPFIITGDGKFIRGANIAAIEAYLKGSK